MSIKLNNINIGNCGEYYVAAELERRGFTVAVPMSNVDNFDILAISRNKPYNQYAIQVKTTTKNNWLLHKKNETINEEHIYYIYVKLVNNHAPEYYIYPSKEIAEVITERHKNWLATPKKNGEPHKDTSMREFDSTIVAKDRWDYFK